MSGQSDDPRDEYDVSQEEADKIFNTERIKKAEEELKRKLKEQADERRKREGK